MSRSVEQVVAAVLISGDSRVAHAAQAISQGSVRPSETVVGADALERATRSGVNWIWVMDGGGIAEPDALERLLEAGADDPACAVATGLVVDSCARPIELLIPSGTESDTETVLTLAQIRRVPVRNATFAHTLVRRETLIRYGLPEERQFGRYAAVEWTARVLGNGDASGVFVPSSVVSRDPPKPRLSDLGAVTRSARTSTWNRGEAVRQMLAVLRRGGSSAA